MNLLKNDTEYRTVLLAAFLHDIGKLLGRGSFSLLEKAQHPQFSADYVSSFQEVFSSVVDADLLKELVQKHHQNSRAFPAEYLVDSITDVRRRTLAVLISKADNLSSSERSENSQSYQDYRTTPLNSVIQRMNNSQDRGLSLKFHAAELPSTVAANTEQLFFPAAFDKNQPEEVNNLIKSFGASFKNYIESLQEIEFEGFMSHLSSLVYRHTWCIPSNTQEAVPDISLFDHLKTTAAIAACLYQYHQVGRSFTEKEISQTDKPRFVIVAGDLSGIQRYIFDIPASAAKGSARRLRARSFFIQMCSEIAAHKILHKLDLPLWNLIMSSGGNFTLLLPNTQETIKVLAETQMEIDRWLLSNLNGELALNLAWHPFGDEDFKTGFGSVIHSVKDLLNEKKLVRFQDCLQTEGRWKETAFVLPVSFHGETACSSCKKYPVKNGQELCSRCSREGEIGSLLPSAGYIACYSEIRPDLLNIFDYSIGLSSVPSFSGNPYLVKKLNDPDLSELSHYSAEFTFLANYVPRENNALLNFQEIAGRADGRHLLGFLKADVDNLGKMIIFGLKRSTLSLDTMSRQTTFSRLMEMFFSGYLEALVSSDFPDCYTVFSGGDDLFFVGPWEQVLDLAEQINQDFHKFTGNDEITISAGVVFTKPGYPIDRAAEMVEEAVETSKKKGRNRLTLLGQTLTWSQWKELKNEWFNFQNMLKKYKVSSAFLYNLLKYAEMWQDYRENGNTLSLRLYPLLAYDIRRNIDPDRMPGLYEWVKNLLVWRPEDSQKNRLDRLGLLVTLCLYGLRGGNE